MKSSVRAMNPLLLACLLVSCLFVLACPGTGDPEASASPAPSPSPIPAVSEFSITGLQAPVRDGIPVTSVSSSQYSGTVSWSPAVPGGFAAATSYTATITLTAAEGRSFTGVPANSFSVAGATVVTNAADSNVVTAVFPSTDSAPVTELGITALPPPVNGQYPGTVIDGSQYAGSVSWSPAVSGPFSGGVIYTATFTLTPAAGYSFATLPENAFTVLGADSVTYAAGSNVVVATYPMTRFYPDMVDVPAGRFQRDATATNVSEVSAFRIGAYEVFRTQFNLIMGVDPSDTAKSATADSPVQTVNWYQAIAFCNKLSIRNGFTPVYSVDGVTDWAGLAFASIPTSEAPLWDQPDVDWNADGYRLPTEMEWMWAAMGAPASGQNGSTDTTGYQKAFPGSTGSNVANDYCWTSANSGSAAHPVGRKTANELGINDMGGNVCELLWDRCGTPISAWPAGTLTDFRGSSSFYGYSMCRGGSWMDSDMGVATRSYNYHPGKNTYIGFRLARKAAD